MSERMMKLSELPDLEQSSGAHWRPIRRAFALTGTRANAYTAVAAGDEVIEPHDELSPSAAGHEELYIVLEGAARFTIDGETFDVPTGAMIKAIVGEQRQAVATEAPTTIFVVGGEPGSALPPAPYEYWYAAEPHYLAGEYDRGIEILNEGLEHHPDASGLNYQLACYHALAGNRDDATRHLRVALEHSDGRIAGWAAEDADLDSIRDDPGFPELK